MSDDKEDGSPDNTDVYWLNQVYAADAIPSSRSSHGDGYINNVYYQRVKLTVGDDGLNEGDVSSNRPLPIALAGTDGETLERVLIELKLLNAQFKEAFRTDITYEDIVNED